MATDPNATNSLWTPHDAPAQVAVVQHDVTENLSALVKTLEGKGEAELRNLKADVLKEESDAKQDLYMLRQRISSLGTDIQTNEEVLLASAKQRVASAMAYIKALEFKIEGKPSTTVPAPETVQDSVPEVTPEVQA